MKADRAYEFLLGLPRFATSGDAAYRPGLERIRTLLRLLGDPQSKYPSIHVAGTNGKGSVASMAAAILTRKGLRVGLHTSPHIHRLEERMRIDGRSAPHGWVTRAVDRVEDHIRSVGASFFEATVALSLLYFAEENVDAALVEVGLGGRFDATNVIQPRLACITDIALEHTDILGSTLREIALEKAGILKSGVPAMTLASGEALEVLSEQAAVVDSTLECVRKTCTLSEVNVGLLHSAMSVRTPRYLYEGLRLDLSGHHQLWNAALAIRLAEEFGRGSAHAPLEEAVRHGLRDVRGLAGLTGRLQAVSTDPLVLVDNAHNPASIEAVLSHVKPFCSGRMHVAIGLMRDKNTSAMADLLAASHADVTVIGLEGERALDPASFEQALKQRGVQVDIFSSVSEVIERFSETADAADVLLVTGSHLLVAKALAG